MSTATRAPASLGLAMLTGSLAGMTASCFTTPIELVKIRLQLQGELGAAARPYGGNPLTALAMIARADGIRALYRGLGPALAYQLVMNGVRRGLSARAFQLLRGWTGPRALAAVPGLDLALRVAAGAAAGMAGAFLGSPLFLVKTRLQVASRSFAAVGAQHRGSEE